jgi:hypothetical protein
MVCSGGSLGKPSLTATERGPMEFPTQRVRASHLSTALAIVALVAMTALFIVAGPA